MGAARQARRRVEADTTAVETQADDLCKTKQSFKQIAQNCGHRHRDASQSIRFDEAKGIKSVLGGTHFFVLESGFVGFRNVGFVFECFIFIVLVTPDFSYFRCFRSAVP